MKVLEVIQRSTEFLARKGIESPRLASELLLAHVLGLPRMQLYLDFERTLTDSELAACRELVKRRGQHEPLQQITGSTSFCGLPIKLNRHVLVPRPETELLAELGWKFLSIVSPSPLAFDLGTGSGCLAVALAAKCPAAKLFASDISTAELALARENAAASGVADRITFFHGDGFSALPEGAKFNLVISNPPYIPSGEIEKLQPEVRDYEPRHALDGGADGMDFYRHISGEAHAFLLPGGKVMLEFGDGQAEPLRQIFTEQNWIVEPAVEDYTRRPRILIVSRTTE